MISPPRRLFWVMVLLTMPATVCPQEAGPPGTVHEIRMSAKKYEFNPYQITVMKGERVRLVITALDRDHGFKLEEFGINEKLLKGTPTIIEFTPDKVGAFPFQCSQFCGLGHRRMKGKLVVEEPASP